MLILNYVFDVGWNLTWPTIFLITGINMDTKNLLWPSAHLYDYL